MKKFVLASLALAAALAISPATFASSIPFSIDAKGISISGTFATSSSLGGGVYVLGGFTDTPTQGLTVPSLAITNDNLVELPTAGYGTDNMFWTSPLNPLTGANFDNKGLDLFDTVNNDYIYIRGLYTIPGYTPSGMESIVIEVASGAKVDVQSGDFNVAGSPVTGFTLIETPEPMPLVLLGTGLLGLAFLAFRKSKASGLVLNS
jgi:hypothetical protein